jgi:hypothetical protein
MKCLVVFTILLLFSTLAYGGESVLYPFQDAPDGFQPLAGLVADSSGNLYGTTKFGGSGSCVLNSFNGCGTIFKLSPNADGTWTESILYSFQGKKDGKYPFTGLALDGDGNLYGTMFGRNACPPACGNLYKLSLDGTFTVLFNFNGNAHGGQPETGVTVDSSGAIYGTTSPIQGISGSNGTIFQFANGKIKTLHAFAGGTDGGTVGPVSTPIFGADGRLYGSAGGGATGYGILYRLNFSDTWHYKAVYSFSQSTGGPRDNLAFDANGRLYGVTVDDRVFQLKQSKVGTWSSKSIHKFSPFSRNGDGFNVQGGVAIDTSGNVYGLTLGGTAKKGYGDGTIYELVPSGSKWTENILHAFRGGNDGSGPLGQIILGPNNSLFGVTESGGDGVCGGNQGICGTVFQMTQ